MNVVLALAAVLSALSGGYLCAPRPAQRSDRGLAPVVELATRPDPWSRELLRLVRRAAARDMPRDVRTGRVPAPRPGSSAPLQPAAPVPSVVTLLTLVEPTASTGPARQPHLPVGDPWLTVAPVLPVDGRGSGRVLRRGPYGAPPAPGGRITLDDDVDIDFQFRSVAMVSSVVAAGDHLDHVQITGHDGRIHVLAEERGRVAFGVLSVGD